MSAADKMLKEIVALAKKLAVQEHENKSLWDSNMQIKQVRDLHAGRLREVEQELQRLRKRHVEVQSEDVAAARAEIETLSTCLAKIRQHVAEMDEQEDLMCVLVDIRSALAELDAGTSKPAPATEPKSNSSVTLTGSPDAEGQQ